MKKSYSELQTELFELIRFQDMDKLRLALLTRYRVREFHKLTWDQMDEFVSYLKYTRLTKEKEKCPDHKGSNHMKSPL